MYENLILHIEALIFSSQHAVNIKDITACLAKSLTDPVNEEIVEKCLKHLGNKFTNTNFAFELVPIGGGYQFLTKNEYHKTIATYLNQKDKKKLSTATMETLSIVAYKQPISKPEIEQIRGVNCDYSIQKLLEKELIEILGRSKAPGKPILYGTSQFFMDYFGINNLEELPKLKEIEPENNEIGQADTEI